ncbi:MAG TPA: DUF2231 domain-containing protein [Vicinamibacteria bacterium]|nr:DUF2231 domain-containing protein [Vicinamibacteria bacterium]
MPSLAGLHPIVVHFAIALLIAGAVFRWLSLTGRLSFASPAAASLLLVGTVAAVMAVKSGTDAHGPVERIPGVVDAVIAHEHWGERARNAFIVVAVAELVVLLLARRGKERLAVIASAVLCVPAVFCLYEAGEHGGELVYEYAGGPGLRTGDPADVGRLLVAGVYNQAQADRKAGRPGDAAALVSAIAPRFATDPNVQVMAAESALLDRKDPGAALDILGRTAVPQDNARLRIRHGLLMADALEAAGRPDAARATLQQLASAFPTNGRIKQRLAGSPAPAR